MIGETALSEALAPCGHNRNPATLVHIADALTNDRILLAAIEMGVVGMGEEHDCSADANAVAELVRTLTPQTFSSRRPIVVTDIGGADSGEQLELTIEPQ